MIEWINVNKQLPPARESVLICVMSKVDSAGNVKKQFTTGFLSKHNKKWVVSDSRFEGVENWMITHWSEIGATPRVDPSIKSKLIDIRNENDPVFQARKKEDELMLQMEKEHEEYKRAERERMKTPEYQKALKEAFDYQDELDRRAALKRAAKQSKQEVTQTGKSD